MPNLIAALRVPICTKLAKAWQPNEMSAAMQPLFIYYVPLFAV